METERQNLVNPTRKFGRPSACQVAWLKTKRKADSPQRREVSVFVASTLERQETVIKFARLFAGGFSAAHRVPIAVCFGSSLPCCTRTRRCVFCVRNPAGHIPLLYGRPGLDSGVVAALEMHNDALNLDVAALNKKPYRSEPPVGLDPNGVMIAIAIYTRISEAFPAVIISPIPIIPITPLSIRRDAEAQHQQQQTEQMNGLKYGISFHFSPGFSIRQAIFPQPKSTTSRL